jgi:hypothetical protein
LDLNPLFIADSELMMYGFQRVATVNEISLEVRTKTTSERFMKIELSVSIEKILYESTARAIAYLSHHFKHIVQ